MSDKPDESIYRIEWLAGEGKLEPLTHRLVWRSHDSFDVMGDYVSMIGWRAEDYGLALLSYSNLTIENERPEKLPMTRMSKQTINRTLFALALIGAVLAMVGLGGIGVLLFIQSGALS